MLRLLLLLFLSISSCVPAPLSTPRCNSTSEELPTTTKAPEFVSDLLYAYTQLFRARQGADDRIDIDVFKEMELKTTVALAKGLVDHDTPYFNLILKLHHKLRSYISFLTIARQHEERLIADDPDNQSQRHLLWLKKIKHDLVGMIAKQLRGAKSNDIDLAITNNSFYQQVTTDDFTLPEITRNDQQEFFNDLIAELIVASEQSIIHYHSLFAFENTDPRDLCSFWKRKSCRQLNITGEQDFSYTDVSEFTELVNRYIRQGNKLSSEFYFLQQDDSSEEKIGEFKKRYQQFLAKAMHFGLVPLFLTDTFRDKSGKNFFIDLASTLVIPKPSTEVTAQTVKRMVADLKKDLVDRWLELKDKKKAPKENKIYQWLVVNEAVTARTVLQKPQHSLVVISLLNKHQDNPNNPKWLRNSKWFTSVVDSTQIGMIGTMFGRLLINKTQSAVKLLPVIGKFVFFFTVVGLLINLPYIAISVVEYGYARYRLAIVQQAVQSGSSMCLVSAASLQQTVDTRQRIIIGNMIGLSLTLVALPATVKLGEEVAFFWTGVLEMISNVASDSDMMASLASLVDPIHKIYQRSLAAEDRSYREIILGDLPAKLAEATP